MNKIKVIFICMCNNARSQMAEAFLNRIAGYRFEAESAGLMLGRLNPIAVEALKEKGIDISKNRTKSIFDISMNGKSYDYVITVCEESKAEHWSKIFPGIQEHLHMILEDPANFKGTYKDKLAKTRVLRDDVEHKVREWSQKFYHEFDEYILKRA